MVLGSRPKEYEQDSERGSTKSGISFHVLEVEVFIEIRLVLFLMVIVAGRDEEAVGMATVPANFELENNRNESERRSAWVVCYLLI
jgi:hypothetical protein